MIIETIKNYFNNVESSEPRFVRNSFIIVILIGFVALSVIFLTSKLNYSSFIGDTVAGILGTCISFGAAILVYISFSAQVKANQEISKQINDERISKMYDLFNNTYRFDTVKSNFSVFEKTCVLIERTKSFDNQLYSDYNNLFESIKDIPEYENLSIIYDTALKASKFKDEDFHKLLLDTMRSKIKPYMWFTQTITITDVPIIKIGIVNNKIINNAKFSTKKACKETVILRTLRIIFDAKVKKQINLNKEVVAENESFEVRFGKIQPNEYKLQWEIEYQNTNYVYKDNETYLIN